MHRNNLSRYYIVGAAVLLTIMLAVVALALAGRTYLPIVTNTAAPTPTAPPADWWQPAPGLTWQWQLSGAIDTSYDVAMYDIDLFEAPQSVIDELHAAGRVVICYFSAGSYEDWRPDAADFPAEVLGNPLEGWPGERWLDIRRIDLLGPIMQARLEMAVQKGCDGVEPDNVDGYANDSGFPLTAADQLAFNRFIANEAHKRNLSVGLKNDLDQIGELVEYFDFAVNEQCHEFDECDRLQPFIDAGKPVFNAEYADQLVNQPASRDQMCAESIDQDLRTLVLPLDLDDSFRFSCDP